MYQVISSVAGKINLLRRGGKRKPREAEEKSSWSHFRCLTWLHGQLCQLSANTLDPSQLPAPPPSPGPGWSAGGGAPNPWVSGYKPSPLPICSECLAPLPGCPFPLPHPRLFVHWLHSLCSLSKECMAPAVCQAGETPSGVYLRMRPKERGNKQEGWYGGVHTVRNERAWGTCLARGGEGSQLDDDKKVWVWEETMPQKAGDPEARPWRR